MGATSGGSGPAARRMDRGARRVGEHDLLLPCRHRHVYMGSAVRRAPSSPPALAGMDVPAEREAEEAVPMWKAIGVPEARASSAAGAFLLEELEDAVAEGDFEKAIELRGQVRLTIGRSNSVHQMGEL